MDKIAYHSRGDGIWENGAEKWDGLRSYAIATLFIRQFILWELWIIWVYKSIQSQQQLAHGKNVFPEEYKQITIASYKK